MGLAQTLLTIAAIAMLGALTFNMNSSYLLTDQSVIQSDFSIEAISIAESYIDRAMGKRFDEKFVSQVTKVNNLTAKSDFNKDAGETTLTDFDDFDDFNGYKANETTERATYNIAITVDYVDELDLVKAAAGKTYYKKITVSVATSYLDAPVIMQQVRAFY